MKKISVAIWAVLGLALISSSANAYRTRDTQYAPAAVAKPFALNSIGSNNYTVLRECTDDNNCTYTIKIEVAKETDMQTWGLWGPDSSWYLEDSISIGYRFALYEKGAGTDSAGTTINTHRPYLNFPTGGGRVCDDTGCDSAPEFFTGSGRGSISFIKGDDHSFVVVKIMGLKKSDADILPPSLTSKKSFTLRYEWPHATCANGPDTCYAGPYLMDFAKDDFNDFLDINLAKVSPPALYDIPIPVVGNDGAAKTKISCGQDEVISGIKIRSGSAIDGITFGCARTDGVGGIHYTNIIGGGGGGGPYEIGPYYGYALAGWEVRTCQWFDYPIIGSLIPAWKKLPSAPASDDPNLELHADSGFYYEKKHIVSSNPSYTNSAVTWQGYGQEYTQAHDWDCQDWISPMPKCADGYVVKSTSVGVYESFSDDNYKAMVASLAGTCEALPSATELLSQDKTEYPITAVGGKYQIKTTLDTTSLTNETTKRSFFDHLVIQAKYEKNAVSFTNIKRGSAISATAALLGARTMEIQATNIHVVEWSEPISCDRTTTYEAPWIITCIIPPSIYLGASSLVKIEAFVEQDGAKTLASSSPPLSLDPSVRSSVQDQIRKTLCANEGGTWVDATTDNGCHMPCTNSCLFTAADHYTCKTKPAGTTWMYLSGVDKCVEAPVCNNGCKNDTNNVSAACTVAPSGYTFDAATNKCTRPSAAPCPISGQKKFRDECKCDPDLGKPKLENDVCVACPTGTHWVAGDVNTCESDTPAPPLPPAPPAGGPKTPTDPGDTGGNGCETGKTKNGYGECVLIPGATVTPSAGKGGGCSLVANGKAGDNLTYPIILMLGGLLIIAARRRMAVRKG